MRDLSRLTLQVVSRTGLFISLTMWAVGQFAPITCRSSKFSVDVNHTGWSVKNWAHTSTRQFEFPHLVDKDVHELEELTELILVSVGGQAWQFPGGEFVRVVNQYTLKIHHWLVVAAFVMLVSIVEFLSRSRRLLAPGNDG